MCEDAARASHRNDDRHMNPPARDFVTVDLCGLKAALASCARTRRVSISALVRGAVARELDLLEDVGGCATSAVSGRVPIKLSIRLTSAEAERLDAHARRAGLSRGALVAQLLDGPPAASSWSAPDCLAALTESCTELATLSRDLRHLTKLLAQGEVRAALEYRRRLDTLGDDVRAHLTLASGLLAEMRPRRSLQRHRPAHDEWRSP